jgi:hypothetical protein
VPFYDPPGGEGWNAFHDRVDRTWEKIERHWYDHFAGRGAAVDFAVVSHGLFLRSLLERRLLSPEALERLGDGQGQGRDREHLADPRRVVPAPTPGALPTIELLACTAHLEADAATPAPKNGQI